MCLAVRSYWRNPPCVYAELGMQKYRGEVYVDTVVYVLAYAPTIQHIKTTLLYTSIA